MIDLSRLVPKLLRANGGNLELAVKLAWSLAAGAGLRRHAVPVRWRERILTVAVADAIWQRQLEHMRAELLFRVNNCLGQKLVDALAFQINPAEVSAAQPAAAVEEAKVPAAPLPDELLFAAKSITDQDLRERFVRAAGNCISRRDSRAANRESDADMLKPEA